MDTKDFDNWNKQKKSIHTQGENKFYHPREVWWCAMGLNIGVEADGKGKEYRRPVIIIKAFNKESCLGVALTGSRKTGKYYFPLGIIDGRESSVNLSQIKILDTKRLVRKMARVPEDVFNELLKKIAIFLAL